jgi:hypothetical protein
MQAEWGDNISSSGSDETHSAADSDCSTRMNCAWEPLHPSSINFNYRDRCLEYKITFATAICSAERLGA